MTAAFQRWTAGEPAPASPRTRSRFALDLPSTGRSGRSPRRTEVVVAVTCGLLVGVAVGAIVARPRPAPPHTPGQAPFSAGAGSSPRQLKVVASPYSASVPAASLEAGAPVAEAPGREEADASPPPRRQIAPSALTTWPSLPQSGYALRAATPSYALAAGAAPAAYGAAGFKARRARVISGSLRQIPREAAAWPICGAGSPDRQYDCLVDAGARADAELRNSYRLAIRRGVSNETLERYRGAWDDLRSEGVDDPARMIAGYRGLAADLMREPGFQTYGRMGQVADDPSDDPE